MASARRLLRACAARGAWHRSCTSTARRESIMRRSSIRWFEAVPAALALSITAVPAQAQEVIVAKQMLRSESRESEPKVRPAIVYRRRADNVVQALLVADDTRNAEE